MINFKKIFYSKIGFAFLVIAAIGLPIVAVASFRYSKAFNAKLSASRYASSPYTVFAREHITDKSGNTQLSQQTITAQRSDGSMLEHHRILLYKTGTPEYRTIYFSDGRKVHIGDHIKSITTWRLPEDELLRMKMSKPDPASNCLATFGGSKLQGATISGLHESILGIETVKIVRDSKSRRLTVWQAPSLGCITLKHLAEFREEGSKDLTTPSEWTVDHVQMGEPDAQLFNVPLIDYEEVMPSEFYVRDMKVKRGHTSAEAEQAYRSEYARQDALYLQRKVK